MSGRAGVRIALVLLLLFYLRSYIFDGSADGGKGILSTLVSGALGASSGPPLSPPSAPPPALRARSTLDTISTMGHDGKRRLIPHADWTNRDGEARPRFWPLTPPLSWMRQCTSPDNVTTVATSPCLVVDEPVDAKRALANLTAQQRRFQVAAVGLAVEADGHRPALVVPKAATQIAVAVGWTPDSPWWMATPVAGPMLWFDPFHAPETPKVGVVAFPLAVGRRYGTATLWTTEANECHGLLKPSWHNENAVAGLMRPENADAFRRCHTIAGSRAVAMIRGEAIADLLPAHVPEKILLVSSVGYDLVAVASFGKRLSDFNAISVSCQDFPPGSPRLFSTSAFTCAEVLQCMRVIAPNHQLVNCDGEPAGGVAARCFDTGIENRDRHCLFRRHGVSWPHVAVAVSCRPVSVEYTPRDGLKCPSIAFDFELETPSTD